MRAPVAGRTGDILVGGSGFGAEPSWPRKVLLFVPGWAWQGWGGGVFDRRFDLNDQFFPILVSTMWLGKSANAILTIKLLP